MEKLTRYSPNFRLRIILLSNDLIWQKMNISPCVFWSIYNFETVKSKYFLCPHRVQQAQMGAVKGLTFMCHFYVLLMLCFLQALTG